MGEAPPGLWESLAGRYTLERELGRGGMATVYLVRDVKHDRPVALKVLHPELAASLGAERFLREVRLAARLQHPHILTVLDSGEAPRPGAGGGGGDLWFTMPFVDGESVRSRLTRERQLPVEDALRIAREAAQALQYAHDHGVIHRDVKPENLLLTRDGSTLVADFGIARAISGAAESKLTETGTMLGTPAYMSPEQAAGEHALDHRTDIYSLGCVLWEMLAGEPPFAAPTAQAMIARRFIETPRPLREVRDTVPEGVERAVAKALAKAPADRFGSAAELGKALLAGEADAHVHASPRRFAVTAALALGFLLGLGVLFGWLRSHERSDVSGGAKRLAVLPFENLGASDDEYFADGVTDEVRGKLASLGGLRVIARSSSGQYKKTTKTPQEIGRELGVDYLLTGTVRWEKGAGGSRVRVSPELIQVGTAATTWQQPFDAALTDVFQVQADIAGRVAEALDVALGDPQKKSLAERPTRNLAAYDAFLKGEEAGQGVGVVDLRALRGAIEHYERAVALDSTFVEAWVQLSRAYSALYFVGTVSPAVAEGARGAAERAARLAPGRPAAQLALGDFQQFVRGDAAAALGAYELGLQKAPADAELLSATGRVEQSLGRWESSILHYTRADAVDPRSVLNARRQAVALLWLRRYPEADAAFDRGIAFSPATPLLHQGKAMVRLAQGDLAGARAVLRRIPPEVDPAAMVASMATYWDLFWVLDEAQQQLLLRLTPSAFDDDRSRWGIALAETYALRGNRAEARAYADSAAAAFESQLRATPDDPQLHALLGTVYAYAGRKADAIREGRLAVEKKPLAADAYTGPYIQHQLARIYLLVGEPEQALDQLEPLLSMPYYLSPGWLRIDPTLAPLRKNPRFQRLAGATAP